MPGKEFKETVIRMLNKTESRKVELTENVKKEIKNTITEKNTLEGLTAD